MLHVPTEKRMNLDFYKNNIIHFFLLPALLTRALLADVPLAGLSEQIAWWLDLYRWEFPLSRARRPGERAGALAVVLSRGRRRWWATSSIASTS